MLLAIVLLIGAVLGAGLLVRAVPEARSQQWLKPLLVFSGAYLFTLTITHLLPEAVALRPGAPQQIGYWVLGGFFVQLLLEALSQGIEHGHVHVEPTEAGRGRVPLALLLALVLHGLLEGSILIGGEHAGAAGRNFYAVVLGVALHHVPAAVALATLLRVRLGSFGRVWPWLGLFALASPAGLVFSNYVVLPQLLGGYYAPLLGFVTGTFLHVSTTILFETSPEHHHLNWRKLGATAGGALLALGVSG